jgi:hypothetical protein
LHGAFNRNSNRSFILVDPGVASERFCVLIAQVFEFLFAVLGALLFVSIAARRRTDDGDHNRSK